jgi:hypothetical protein
VAERYDEPLRDLSDVDPARYAELRSAHQAIQRDEEELRLLGIRWRSLGIDHRRAVVSVEVVADDAGAARAVLRERYGDRVDMTWLGRHASLVEEVSWGSWWLDADGRRIVVRYTSGPSREPLGATCDETDDAVRVTVRERVPVGGSEKMSQVTRYAEVELAEPLGDRRVFAGTTTHEPPRRRTEG